MCVRVRPHGCDTSACAAAYVPVSTRVRHSVCGSVSVFFVYVTSSLCPYVPHSVDVCVSMFASPSVCVFTPQPPVCLLYVVLGVSRYVLAAASVPVFVCVYGAVGVCSFPCFTSAHGVWACCKRHNFFPLALCVGLVFEVVQVCEGRKSVSVWNTSIENLCRGLFMRVWGGGTSCALIRCPLDGSTRPLGVGRDTLQYGVETSAGVGPEGSAVRTLGKKGERTGWGSEVCPGVKRDKGGLCLCVRRVSTESSVGISSRLTHTLGHRT